MNKLADLINDAVISMRQLSKETGVGRPTLAKIANGEKVRVLTVKKVCRYFGVDYKDYLE